MKSIYRSVKAKAAVIALYDKQMNELTIPFKDVYLKTSFGRTHLVERRGMPFSL